MDKKLSEIFEYNVKNSSNQLLMFIELVKEDNWDLETLIVNVEWVAKEMQEQYKNNYKKFVTAEVYSENMMELIQTSLNKFTHGR